MLSWSPKIERREAESLSYCLAYLCLDLVLLLPFCVGRDGLLQPPSEDRACHGRVGATGPCTRNDAPSTVGHERDISARPVEQKTKATRRSSR